MDVIRFLCVSLGSSTVQLHDSLDADALVKMATVLEKYTTEEQRYVVRLYGQRTQCKKYS
jgi:hypothetical protein